MLLIISSLLNYFFAGQIYRRQNASLRKFFLAVSMVADLGILAYFKYTNFLIDSLNTLLQSNFALQDIILPIGISFYTFQTMSYTIDVYRREIEPAKSFLDFTFFVCFFPQLVAGPIVRAKDFIPQIYKKISLTKEETSFALFLIIFGFSFSNKTFTKTVIKNKNNIVDVVFILDRSGSMGGLESDTIGGFNSMLEKQRKIEGKAFITTVLFDDQYELLHDRVNIAKVNNITEKEYFVRGSTALLDAIGKTIAKEKAIQDTLGKNEKADKVLFVIITDGLENASKEYSSSTVKKLIETQKEKYGWEFLFLGANIDAIETANSIGISAERAVNYNSDSIGTKKNYDTLNKAVEEVRSGNELKKEWKADIEKDYNERKNNMN